MRTIPLNFTALARSGFIVMSLLMAGCRTTSVPVSVGTAAQEPWMQEAALILVVTPIVLTLHLLGVRTSEGPPILKTGSDAEIRADAVRAARADMAAGKPRVAFSGGIASWPIGIPQEHWHLVERLPKVPLPSGCTVPYLAQASVYAEAYNKEMLGYLLERHTAQYRIIP